MAGKTGGENLTKTELLCVFIPAWKKTCTVENARADFRGTGIFPFNTNPIQREVFAPSLTTDNNSQPPQDTIARNSTDGVQQLQASVEPNAQLVQASVAHGDDDDVAVPPPSDRSTGVLNNKDDDDVAVPPSSDMPTGELNNKDGEALQ